jgi:hypothetical protein
LGEVENWSEVESVGTHSTPHSRSSSKSICDLYKQVSVDKTAGIMLQFQLYRKQTEHKNTKVYVKSSLIPGHDILVYAVQMSDLQHNILTRLLSLSKRVDLH